MYRILLVEDEEIIRKGIRASINWKDWGCIMEAEAENGEEGRRLIEQLNPDIVITDINMPLMDGLEMISSTKEKHHYTAIILTGYSEFEYARKAITYGVNSYILKPLDIEEMKQALKQAVQEVRDREFLTTRELEKAELKNRNILKNNLQEREDAVVKCICDYVEENYKNKILLSDLEKELNYSERYMNQRFRQVMGTTIIDYVNRFRIQKAMELLLENKIAISQIGWECGIGEYKYFNYVFKKYIGCSAKEYQKKVL